MLRVTYALQLRIAICQRPLQTSMQQLTRVGRALCHTIISPEHIKPVHFELFLHTLNPVCTNITIPFPGSQLTEKKNPLLTFGGSDVRL